MFAFDILILIVYATGICGFRTVFPKLRNYRGLDRNYFNSLLKINRLHLTSPDAEYADIVKEIKDEILKSEEETIKTKKIIEEVEIEIKETAKKVESSTGKEKQYWIDIEKYLRDKEKALIDEEKALIDKEKALIDKEKALIDKEILDRKALQVAEAYQWEILNFSVAGLDNFQLPTYTGDTWKMMDVGMSTDMSSKETSLYARNDTLNLLQFLSDEWTECAANDKRRVAFVNGPPGVGKSCIVLSWAMYMAASEEVHVLWLRKGDGAYLFNKDIQNGTCLKSRVFGSLSPVAVYFQVPRPDKNIIILDGFAEDDNINELVVNCNQLMKPRTLLLACTSYRSGRFNGDMTVRLNIPRIFLADSWSLAEIREAKKVLKWKIDLDKQYYYSRGSVRYFLMSIEVVQQLIDQSVKKVHDFSVLLKGQLGDSSAIEVNSLQYLRKGDEEIFDPFLSPYVRWEIIRNAKESFIDTVLNLNRKNPTWKGLVFEWRVFRYLSKYPFRYWLKTKKQVAWVECPNPELKFWEAKEIGNLIIKSNSTGQWIIPGSPQQPCFDALYVDPRKERVDAVQITIQKAHKYEMGALVPWLAAIRDKWGMETIDLKVVQLSPEDKADKVTFNPKKFKNVHKLPDYVHFSVTSNCCFILPVYKKLKMM